MGRKKITISFAASAVGDLEEIREWYIDQDARASGEKIIKDILSQVERLTNFPESGRIVPEFGVANLREIIHPPFRIAYRLEKNRVRIVRVRRSERLLKSP